MKNWAVVSDNDLVGHLVSSLAARDMEDLDLPIAARIRRAVRRFVETGHGDVRRLTGRQLEWRLRIGRWRVLFTFDREAQKS